jgi:hypothetical protein
MANLFNWGFYQEHGAEGGVAAGNGIVYVDSHNGSDVTGDGTHDNPVASLQKAHDTIANPIIVAAGYFRGGFIGVHCYIHAEGDVIIDADGDTLFGSTTAGRILALNFDGTYGRSKHGTIKLKDFSQVAHTAQSILYAFDTTFINCSNIIRNNGNRMNGFKNNIVQNCVIGLANGSGSSIFGLIPNDIEHNTFINSTLNITWTFNAGNSCNFRSNHFDTTSKLRVYTGVGSDWETLLFANGTFDYNHFEGTLTDKIVAQSTGYNNTEAFRVAFPQYEVNGIPSTTAPLFNDPANEDYTLQEASPLSKTGHDKLQIGALNVADVSETNPNNPTKMDFVNIDFTTSGEITLVNEGIGTAITKSLHHHQIAPKKRLILKTLAPNLEQNYGLGEVMSHNLSDESITSGLDELFTPTKTSIEIQYSTESGTLDDGVVGSDATYNGTWLAVPIGVQPLHDVGNNVGNDDPRFDINNAAPIKAKYVKMKITLRSDETQI